MYVWEYGPLKKMVKETQVQIDHKAICISHMTYILGKGINPTILSPSTGTNEGTLGLLTLVWQLVYEKEFKPVKFC